MTENKKLSIIEEIVSAYNELEEASLTWSRKDKRVKLHDHGLTPVTSKGINEYLIASKYKQEKDVEPLTVEEFKDFSKANVEDIKYFDIPLIDGYIDEEAIKDFDKVHDDEDAKYVYWSGYGNIKTVRNGNITIIE